MGQPRFGPVGMPQGVPQQVNWAADVAGQPATVQPVAYGQGAGAPDLASQMAAAQAVQGAIAKQQQDAGRLPADVVDAMASRETIKPKAEKIKRQFATADAIRNLGSELNTGSERGGAPNWAGALANIAGAYVSNKERKQAEADALGLGTQEESIARKYFGAAPKSSLFGG